MQISPALFRRYAPLRLNLDWLDCTFYSAALIQPRITEHYSVLE